MRKTDGHDGNLSAQAGALKQILSTLAVFGPSTQALLLHAAAMFLDVEEELEERLGR